MCHKHILNKSLISFKASWLHVITKKEKERTEEYVWPWWLSINKTFFFFFTFLPVVRVRALPCVFEKGKVIR